MTHDKADNIYPLTINLEGGEVAERMGDGLFLICQRDEGLNAMQDVVLSSQDLKTLGTSQALTIPLEDGNAEYMGDDLWCILQASRTPQSVVLCRSDLGVMLAAA